MSGECDKCGKHALECMCQKHIPGTNDKFYYRGKFFEKEDEFMAYVKDFALRQTTAESFNDLFDILKTDVFMNLSIRKTKISNSELETILEETFLFILQRILKEYEIKITEKDEKNRNNV